MRGFTLFETLVVLAIASLLMATAGPRFGRALAGLQEREFTLQFAEGLRRTRLQAMSAGLPAVFRINAQERFYALADGPERPIPENAEVFADRVERDPATGEYRVRFYPDGSHTGNRVELVFDGKRSFIISLHPLFGTVSTVRREG